MEPLRFITCGSVNDGKSTLIERLLDGAKRIYGDSLQAHNADFQQVGAYGDRFDFVLGADGFKADWQLGTTADVAYRFFATPNRRFIVADTLSQEQQMRNMIADASTAHAAVLVVDARKGILTQTKHHSRIAKMLGIRQVALAVNKMDLVGWSQPVFRDIELAYRQFASSLGFDNFTALPVSALEGHNVVEPGGPAMPWYSGPTLLQWLDEVPAAPATAAGHFAMPVQWVNQPNPDIRAFCGRVTGAEIKVGDVVHVSPSGVASRIKAIKDGSRTRNLALPGDAVMLLFEEEIDVRRGDVIVAADHPIDAADQFEVDLIWMSEHPLLPGRTYDARIHDATTGMSVTHIKHRLDIDTGAHIAAKHLGLNEIATVNVSFERTVPFTAYAENMRLGGFIVIDKLTNETAGAGMIKFALRRASNLRWQGLDVTKAARAALKQQRAHCFWFTGLSGSGKSTIANLLEKRLHAEGKHTYILDGDNVRHGLNRDLGFTEADRVENVRRIAEVAKLFVDAGLIVIVSSISPYRAERKTARGLFEQGEFIEVFVDTPLAECERRDVKGLYAKARAGKLKNFTGIDSAYEPPEYPDVHLSTPSDPPEQCVDKILFVLEQTQPAADWAAVRRLWRQEVVCATSASCSG